MKLVCQIKLIITQSKVDYKMLKSNKYLFYRCAWSFYTTYSASIKYIYTLHKTP